MEVICISAKFSFLTLNKKYILLEEGKNYYRVISDKNIVCTLTKDIFMTVEEYRDNKIKQIIE